MEKRKQRLIGALIVSNKENKKLKSIIDKFEERLVDFGSDYVFLYITKDELEQLKDNDFVVLYEEEYYD